MKGRGPDLPASLTSAARLARGAGFIGVLALLLACDAGPAPPDEQGAEAAFPAAPVELRAGRAHPRLVILSATCTLNRSFLGP